MKFLLVIPILAAFLSSVQATPVRDIQHELKLDDAKWQPLQETDTTLSWRTKEEVTVTLSIVEDPGTKLPDSSDLTKVRDYYRQYARDAKGYLIEADVLKADGVRFHCVTMKFRNKDIHESSSANSGFTYRTVAFIPTAKGYYALETSAAESGLTGVRETTYFIIYARDEHKNNFDEAMKNYHHDPYDPAHSKDAMYCPADDRKHDKDFPEHSLSRCRAQMDALLKTWSPGDKVRAAARDKE